MGKFSGKITAKITAKDSHSSWPCSRLRWFVVSAVSPRSASCPVTKAAPARAVRATAGMAVSAARAWDSWAAELATPQARCKTSMVKPHNAGPAAAKPMSIAPAAKPGKSSVVTGSRPSSSDPNNLQTLKNAAVSDCGVGHFGGPITVPLSLLGGLLGGLLDDPPDLASPAFCCLSLGPPA